MSAGNYLSPEMEVPDTYDVAMDYGNLLFTWNSMFGNRHYGEGHDMLLGTARAIFRDESDRVRYASESTTPEASSDKMPPAKAAPDVVGATDATDLHLQNFFDCVRSRKEPNCPFELGFRSAITCRMALTAHREGRRVTWKRGARRDRVRVRRQSCSSRPETDPVLEHVPH